ncbi:hypothetical protein [Empedobacter tilapiae]|uniref:DUF4595 domain-containing protein n=1 Tax=Empedobacter tilapiae TaxID=2491114 RepID=A0A4Z1B6M7_9FLAO|nr:hypothetical protein [Empedobacter tilapiae]TGN23744.1 hypothetical protein E4J94_14935 [Empedobacter tilapiae]
MKKIILFTFLTFSFISFTSCSSDDDSKTNQNNIVEKRLIERITYTEGYDSKLVENFIYDNQSGFVSERISSNVNEVNISKYEYSNNKVIEKRYRNNNLRNTNIYSLKDNIYTIQSFDSDDLLISTSVNKIENKKIVSSKKYNNKGEVIYDSSIEYKDNFLTEIETESISNVKTIRTFLSNKIKNFNAPFAYIVTNDQPLNKTTETFLNGNIKYNETKYEFDKDFYPIKVTTITQNGNNIITINTYNK